MSNRIQFASLAVMTLGLAITLGIAVQQNHRAQIAERAATARSSKEAKALSNITSIDCVDGKLTIYGIDNRGSK